MYRLENLAMSLICIVSTRNHFRSQDAAPGEVTPREGDFTEERF